MIQVAGKAVGTLLGLMTLAVMTRALGDAGFGQFTIVTSFLQLFGILVDFGLMLTLTKLISVPGADERRIASNIFTIRLVSGAACFGLAAVAALAFPYPNEVKAGIALASLSFYAMSLSQLLVGIFQRHLTTHLAAIAEVAGRAVLFGGALIASAIHGGLMGFIIALVASNAVQFALSFAFSRRHAVITLDFDFALWKKIIAESWPIGVAIALNLVYLKGDIVILSLFRPAAEVGLYGAAYKVLDVITVVPMIFMGLVLPIIAASWVAGRKEDVSRRLERSFDAMTIMALGLAFGTPPVATDLMRLLAGNDFAASGAFLSVLMLAAAMVCWGGVFSHATIALGLQRPIVIAYAIDAVVSIGFYLWSIPRFGAIGAAWVTVFAEAFITAATALAVTRALGKFPFGRAFAPALAAAVIMTSTVVLASSLHVLLRIALGALTYAAFLLLFGAIDRKTLVGMTGRTANGEPGRTA